MTNQTIPPCPLCGTVPEVDAQFDDECKPRCGHIRSPVATIMIDDWTHSCNYELGRACRELGIETVEQLRAKVQPDPRAAVLEAAIQQHKRNVSIGVKNANQCLWYVIAAQRVEVEG